MPGRMSKPPQGIGKGSGISNSPRSTPVRQPVVIKRPINIPRPAPTNLNRSVNINRLDNRTIRRVANNQIANEIQARPRPLVKPIAPPVKVMPKQQAPVQQQLVRPLIPPSSTQRQKGLEKPFQPGGAIPRPKQIAKPGIAPTTQQEQAAPKTPIQFSSSQPFQRGTGAMVTAGAVTATLASVNMSAAPQEISSEISILHSSVNDLQSRMSLTNIQSEIIELDSSVSNALNLLEGARSKGYSYQKDLDEMAYQTADRWQAVREQVSATIQQDSRNLQARLGPLNSQISRLNSSFGNSSMARSLVGPTQSQVNSVLTEVDQIEGNLRNSYADIENNIRQLNSRLTIIHWALTQLGEAKVKLDPQESLIMAVEARWDQSGDTDPEGILYLTNQRIIFEQKEKVAKKKVLFITLASELIQEVLLDKPLSLVKSEKAINKGLFGHQDFIEIEFSEPKLGTLPFHLDGQDASGWANWIAKARSGEIETNRTTGSGISYADMTGPLTKADLLDLQNDVNALQDEVTLTGIRDELAKIENSVRSLERKLVDLRSRGYAIEKDLEAEISILSAQWDRIKNIIERTVETQANLLNEQMQVIRNNLANLMGMADNLAQARPQFMELKSVVASLEAQADAAEEAILAQYDEYADEVEVLDAHLDWIGWMLDAIATSSFSLLATESGVAAIEAIWDRPGMEIENGILFLTDQRLLWEDRVEKFELDLDLPIQNIVDVQSKPDDATQQESLIFTLSSGGPYPALKFILGLPVANSWLKMVGRARSGDYALDRAVPLDPQELERIRNAPQQCSNCGAAFTNPILRGQTEINCEYCGVTTRI